MEEIKFMSAQNAKEASINSEKDVIEKQRRLIHDGICNAVNDNKFYFHIHEKIFPSIQSELIDLGYEVKEVWYCYYTIIWK